MSLMSLMQGAITGTSAAKPSPNGGYVPPSPDQILAALQANGLTGNDSSSTVKTPTTRARNASIGDPSPQNPLVYWGDLKPKNTQWATEAQKRGDFGSGVLKPTGGGDHQLTAEQATNQIYKWNQQKIQEMTTRLKAAGYSINSFDDLGQAWSSVVNRAMMMYSVSNGKNKVTPDDVIAMSTNGSAGGFGGPHTVSSTSRSVNTLTEGQSWSVLKSALQQELGRDPSDRETRDFAYRMNILAAKNPSITHTTQTTNADGTSQSSSSKTTGGFTADDAMQAAQARAQADPDYGAYQSATTYFNALQSALGPVGG